MVAQPTGTVTLVFTDIEGSTRLLDRLGAEEYARALDLHRRLLRDAFGRYGGYEVDAEGDAFFVVFPAAEDAVEAASEAQRALGEATWPGEVPIRVRMGIHTGEPLPVPPKYVGMDVHRAARIMATAYGGQVLLSPTTRELVADRVSVRDLGEHRLKDLSAAQRLYQLGTGDFPPLRSLAQTNLPVQPLPLIGRVSELEEVTGFLRRSRLLTLTGAGGSGKTRLALQAAAELVEAFPDGVWFVSLASTTDPALVEAAVARELGVVNEDLATALASRRLLLLLDNLEQLLPGVAPVVARLLEAPDVRVLATSRARLALDVEQEYPVPTLALDEAAALFTARARRLKPTFEPDAHVVEIAARLDGLPLAVELAAARIKVLTPAQIVERLGRSLELLTGGAVDVPSRQQTLRATIEWSYALLAPDEQRLLASLAVFAGAFDLETAEKVGGADVDTLGSLVDKNLLRQTDEGRFFMLETIREYASGRLEETGAGDEIRERHALQAIERASKPARAQLSEWRAAIWRDYADFRSALEWLARGESLDHFETLVCRLSAYWNWRGDVLEGRRWIEAILAADETVTLERLKARLHLVQLLRNQGDLGAARTVCDRARSEAAELNELEILADAEANCGAIAYVEGELDEAAAHYEAAIELLDQLGESDLRAALLNDLGTIALGGGDVRSARAYVQQAIDLAVTRELGAIRAGALGTLGFVALEERRLDEAAVTFHESLSVYADHGDLSLSAATDAYGFAAVIALSGDAFFARVVVGALDAHFERHGAIPEPMPQVARDRVLAAAVRLSPTELERAASEGSSLSLEQTIAKLLTR